MNREKKAGAFCPTFNKLQRHNIFSGSFLLTKSANCFEQKQTMNHSNRQDIRHGKVNNIK